MSILTAQLRDALHDEIVTAVGLPRTWLTRSVMRGLFQRLTNRLAHLGATFDQITKAQGLSAASEWALTHFCTGYQVHGDEHIPDRGPLLVVSNHPGAYDSLVLFASLRGHKIRCVASVIPFINLLPNVREHILFAPRDDARERMLVLRNAIKHLNEGGTLVYFASGHRDPDPAVYPGADRSIDLWLDVFDTFFKYVKGLRVQPAIVSGVVSGDWVKHPITLLRKKQIDRQRLAEFGQVIAQLREPGKLMMKPRLSIGSHFTEQDLRRVVPSGKLLHAVIDRGRALYHESSTYFGDFFG
jgi:1-acyl-sn-glycerol-3-phosphate acyltransferase